MRVSEGGPSIVNSESVDSLYGTVALESVTNFAVLPSARTTVIASPLCIRPRYQKTAGPLVQSRWPAITALPTSPGAAPSLNHATLLACDGTPIRPCGSIPTCSTAAFTLMDGTSRRVGAAAAATMARACASAWSGVALGAGADADGAGGSAARDAATGARRHGTGRRPVPRT